MFYRTTAAGSAAAFILSSLGLLSWSGAAHAQSATEQLPELVVTANRTAEPLSATGSAISVVNSDTIATTNPGSLVDALRSVPGLDISETGGPGGTTSVRMRGGSTGQTLVLIDGIRVNDPASASGDFDFAMFAPSAIDRIEVLRGPQSALYGSDAMGGVINIISKKGTGPPQFKRADRRRQLRHRLDIRLAHGIAGAVVLRRHRQRHAQQRLFALRLSHSRDRSAVSKPRS